MSKHQFVSSVCKEIDELNTAIDRRIVRGRAYRDLARRHKELTRKLNSLERRNGHGIFSFFFS